MTTKPRRNYHEEKAMRCMQSIITMKRKLEKLGGVRVKIENIISEIDAIQSSTVTLRCIECNGEFPIPFEQFTSGEYPLFCIRCQGKSEEKYFVNGPIYPNSLWRVR
jgi:hypothetical protein